MTRPPLTRAYVVGAGAVGTFLGTKLAAAGVDVAYAARELDRVEPAVAQVAIVAVKSYATGDAVATLHRAFGTDVPPILTVQNGVGNEERLAQAFGLDRVVSGALTIPVERHADGTIEAANRGGLVIAPVGNSDLSSIAATFAHTDVPTETSGDYRALKWSKLALNIVANASCAILDELPARALADAGVFACEIDALREMRAIMRVLGIRAIDLPRYPVRMLFALLDLPKPVVRVLLRRRIAGARGRKEPSLLIDVRAGRDLTEIDAMNGAVARAASSAGLAAPVNATFARMVAAVARDAAERQKYRHDVHALLAQVRAARS